MGSEEKISGSVLAMYDVRGIQKYIYSTSKLKDAMGASQLIENIITDALGEACKKSGVKDVVLLWDDEEKAFTYDAKKHDVEVLYIGGGNAYVMFRDRALCKKINEYMSRYIIEHTYSLQLAVACVDVTKDYSKDYNNIFKEMNKVKSNMTDSKPLGALLPVMEIELKTGLPVVNMEKGKYKADSYRGNVSKETYLKMEEKNKGIKEERIDKILDNYARRGIDSRIAVVHIDGNNMGLRIRKLIKGIDDYVKAVNKMREISHNIKYSYLNTFNNMKDKFENMGKANSEDGNSLVKKFVRKVIVAGDDITYVCNAYIALDTVRYFCEEISKLSMYGEDIQEYGFSVCAGIAYVNSHFPFGIAYEVAESCCDSAKEAAKKDSNKAYYKNDQGCFEKTGNFVDFQICKNIQCRDLEQVRKKEFISPAGEMLMQRPYYIPMPFEEDELNRINGTKINNFDNLMDNIKYFANEDNIPHSFAKDIRNTYHMGSNQINLLGSFLDSRNWKMPGELPCKDNMYVDYKGVKTAAWYDALEIMDYCMDVYMEDKEVAENEN